MSKYTYKDLLTGGDFLKCRLRARQLMRTGTDLLAIKYADRQLIFRTASGTYGKRVIWTQTIEITDAFIENIQNKSFKDVEDLLRNSGLKCHCNCPAFLFWGYKYMAWKRGYGLEKERRRPRVRNPFEQGHVCKHLYLVLSLFPFWVKPLAKKFKDWADSKETQQTIKNLERARMNKANRQFIEDLPQFNQKSEDELLEEELDES